MTKRSTIFSAFKTFNCILCIFLCTSCATFKDDPICAQDAPTDALCVWIVSNKQQHVDNSGNNQFTDHGRDWNFSQLQQNSLILPPDSWGDLKASILQYCHDNPDKCEYSSVNDSINFVESARSR